MTCKVKQAVNGWFTDLVKDAVNPVFGMLGKSLLATPEVDHWSRVTGLWSGSVVVANAVFVLFVLAGGLILMGHGSIQTSYTAKDIAPRLVIAMVLANFSLLLVGQVITLANALSAALLGQGVDPDAAAKQLSKIILHALNPTDIGMFVVAVTAWTVVLGLILTFIYVIRMMLTILLIVAAPLALACHALPQTEGLAKLWWRAFIGVLAIQVAQALVFITAMRIFFTTDMVTTFGVRGPRNQLDLWIVACLLYILVRIPSWISRQVWRGGLSASPISRTAKTIAALLIFRSLGAAGNAGGSAAAGRPRSRSGSSPPSSSSRRTSSTPARWVQPELPLGRPGPHGEQLEIPMAPGQPALQPQQPQQPRPDDTQLRLPTTTSRPAYWRQPGLFGVGHEQTRLPAPPPRRYSQPELPLAFPQRGSPAAGRSARRLADTRALRDAEARARAPRPPPNPRQPPPQSLNDRRRKR